MSSRFLKRRKFCQAVSLIALAAGRVLASHTWTSAGMDSTTPWTELSLVRCDNGKVGYIDSQGRLMIACRYDAGHDFSEGLAAIGVRSLIPGESRSGGGESPAESSNFQWGFIDQNGTPVIPAQFPFVQDFSEGLAAVQIHGKWGFIDQNDAFAVPARYQA